MYRDWKRRHRDGDGFKERVHTVAYKARTKIWNELFDQESIRNLLSRGAHVFQDRQYGLNLEVIVPHPIINTRDVLCDRSRLAYLYEQIAWAYVLREYGANVVSCNEIPLRVVCRDFSETAARYPPFSFLELMRELSDHNVLILGFEDQQI